MDFGDNDLISEKIWVKRLSQTKMRWAKDASHACEHRTTNESRVCDGSRLANRYESVIHNNQVAGPLLVP